MNAGVLPRKQTSRILKRSLMVELVRNASAAKYLLLKYQNLCLSQHILYQLVIIKAFF
jgi:hypothetical protein